MAYGRALRATRRSGASAAVFTRPRISPGTSISAPINISPPQVTGVATVGATLTTTNGAWSGAPTAFNIQWTRAGAPIAGATSSTYTVVSADSGQLLTARVTASNAAGTGNAADSVATTGATSASSGSGTLPTGSTTRGLWVGNSLTDSSLLNTGANPETVYSATAALLSQMGRTLLNTAAIQGGATFLSHAANTATMAMLADTQYDFVNLQGYASDFYTTSGYTTRAQPLATAVNGAGNTPIWEAMWHTGEHTYIQSRDATIAAVAAYGGSRAQVSEVWNYFEVNDPTFYAAWKLDSEHASYIGQWATALAYARFFTGESISATTYANPGVTSATTLAQRNAIKAAVDNIVTVFYNGVVAPTASITISAPAAGATIASGAVVTHTATATDTSSGALTAAIEWRDETGLLLARGGSYSSVMASGNRTIYARVVGSDSKAVIATRSYTVAAASNIPPVANSISTSTSQNTTLKQVNLTAYVTDSDGTVDWTTLQINSTGFRGVSVAQDPSLSTVNFNYSNGFIGTDTVQYRVADNQGAYSNWATITVAVVVSAETTFDTLYSGSFTLAAPTVGLGPGYAVAKPTAKAAGVSSPSYTDATGAKVYRVGVPTDFGGATEARNYYSRRNPFNIDNTYFLEPYWGLMDGTTLQPITRTGTNGRLNLGVPYGENEIMWHPTDPKKVWYTTHNGGFTWYELNVDTEVRTTLFNLNSGNRITGVWPTANAAWMRFEGSYSRDGRYWCFMVDDASFNAVGIVTYDRQTDTILGMLPASSFPNAGARPDHTSMTPNGDWATISWVYAGTGGATGGTWAYSLDLTVGEQMHTDSTHSDLGILPDGRAFYFYWKNNSDVIAYRVLRRSSGTGAICSAPITVASTSFGSGTTYQSLSGHVSCQAFDRPGWAIVSSAEDTSARGAAITDSNVQAGFRWIWAIEIKDNGTTHTGRKLLIGDTQSNEAAGYTAEIQGAVNRAGTRILFNTNFSMSASGGFGYSHMVGLPSWAIPAWGA